MTAPQWEPSAESVEALARETWTAPGTWPRETWEKLPEWQRESQRAEARFVLRRQHEREDGLVRSMQAAITMIANSHSDLARERLANALAAHAKLDAKSEPTLLEAAKAVLPSTIFKESGSNITFIDAKNWEALKAAVEREEAR